MSEKETEYGFYSQKYVNRGYATHIYEQPDGGEVEVCFVSRDRHGGLAANYDDLEFVGEVTKPLRQGKPDTSGIEKEERIQ